MKKLVLFIFIVFSIISSISISRDNSINQIEIIGTWQVKDSSISSTYGDLFRFETNNRFIFFVSGYNNIATIIAVEGNYYIRGDSIYLKIINIIILRDGDIEFGNKESDLDQPINYNNAKKTKIKSKKNHYQALPFKLNYNEGKQIQSIDIGGFIYFKYAGNPDD